MYTFCQVILQNILKKNGKIMNLNNAFLRGTLLLSLAGLISRIMGFFYRIFLANTIGAEGMGIYQLIFPIYGICFSLCASGIETSISKLTAAKQALGQPKEALNILKTGLILSLILSISCSLILTRYADFLAQFFLKDPRCASLLKILAFTIPLGTAQSCICGYYFGIRKAVIPSSAQLVEQAIRELNLPDIEFNLHTPTYQPIPLNQVGNELRKSSIALILTNLNAKGMMTTKFFEALGCEKPVLCIPSDNGLLAETIRETNAGLASSDINEIKAFITKKYQEWQLNGFTRQAVVHKEKFSRQQQAQQFEQLFLQCIQR